MIKTLEVSLGEVGALIQSNPVGLPAVEAGQVFASGYYTDELTGQAYYYSAPDDQWYYVSAGLLYPLAISWKPSPSPMIDLTIGDTLRFLMSFYFMGPLPITQTFRVAVGNNSKLGSFNEWFGFNAKKSWVVPASDVPVLHSNYYVDLLIPSGHQGEDGAAYCKKDQLIVVEGQDVTPYYYDVCHIIPAEGEFTSFSITKFEKVE